MLNKEGGVSQLCDRSGMELGPRTRKLVSGSRWKDDYPAKQEYADELETLLNFLESQGQCRSYIGRLEGPNKQRNAALMELRVALHLDRSGYPVVKWSPLGAGVNEGEFVVEGPDKRRVFVEVKGPEWESEVPKDELKAGRSRQPKYIDMEGQSIPPRYKSIQFAVDKAYKKFRDDTPNLLVIADHLFIPLEHETEFEAESALYSDSRTSPGYFSDRRYEKLGGVAVFWVRLGRFWISEDKQSLDYQMRLF